MSQFLRDIGDLFKVRSRNCSPLCAHCEIEVSEKTALAISKLLSRRIKEISEDSKLAAELIAQKELILKGAWHQDYDLLP